jgi:hypothetical protein
MLSRPQSVGVLLLCLDALTLSSDSDRAFATPDPAWRANAAQLLAHARDEEWAIGHVISRRPRPGEAAWRPADGLAPLPTEAVYHREGPSAFSSGELCAVLAGQIRPEVVLCGVSVNGSGLATALDALRLNLRLTLAVDAVGLTPAEHPGLDGLLRLQRMGHLPSLVRQAATAALIAPWRPLSVVKGGRG